MVFKMSSSRINDYKEEAKAEMRRCDGRQIRLQGRINDYKEEAKAEKIGYIEKKRI